MISTRFVAWLPPISIAAGLGLWELIGRLSPSVVFAPASAAFLHLLHETTTWVLPSAIGHSLLTLGIGYTLAAAVALPLGFAMGRVAWIHELLHPVLTGIYAIPPAAFIPFLIVWFGLFAQSRVAVVVIMCFFEMLVITATGARAIDRRLLDVARSFLAPRRRVIGAVLIPASLPFLFTALRIGLVRAVAGVITAELLLSPANLGKLLLDSAGRFNTAGMLGVLATVAMIGLAVQQVLRLLERRVLRWEQPWNKMTRLALRLAGLTLFLILWELVGRRLGNALLAPPSAVTGELVALVEDPNVRATIWQSITPALVGFALACVVGMPLGAIMGRSPVWNALLHPWVSTFVVTSVAAVVPILILLIGTGWWFVVAVVVLSSVWYVTLTTYQGAARIERRWLDVGRSFGASRFQAFRTIMLPALFPYLLAGARVGLIHAIRSMILAQLFIVTGIGGLLNEAGMDVSTARLLALLVVIMGIGLAASHGLGRVANWLAPWQRGMGSLP